MDLIETFGAKIGALSEEKPQRGSGSCSPPVSGPTG